MATQIVNITVRFVILAAIGAASVALALALDHEAVRRGLLFVDVISVAAICTVLVRKVRG